MNYFTVPEIDYFLSNKYADPIIYNHNIDYTNLLFTDNNKQLFQKELDNWRYDGGKFRLGGENLHPRPILMGYLSLCAKFNKFIPFDVYNFIVTNKYELESFCEHSYMMIYGCDDKTILEARSYQTYTSYLRECDVVMKIKSLCKSAKIYKNLYYDINYCVDLIVYMNNKKYNLAIEHSGGKSLEHENKRKREKREKFEKDTGEIVTRLTAPHYNNNQMIELVTTSNVMAIFLTK